MPDARRSRFARPLSLIAVAALASTSALFGVTAAHAATTSLQLDCATLPYSSQTMYVTDPADTYTFSLTGFDSVYDYSTNSDIAPLDPAGDTYVVSAGQELSFYDTTNTCTDYFDISVEEAAPETVPSGDLLFTEDISIPTDASEITVTEDEDGEHFLGGIPTCGISTAVNGQHVYGTLDITVLAAGEFTFRGLYSTPQGYYIPLQPYDPIGDPFLAVYQTFDPTQPDVGVVGCNDDLNDIGPENDAEELADGSVLEGHQPSFTANLTPGRYTLVLATWEDLDAANFAAGYGPYEEESFTPGVKTTRFQLFGPAGALAVGDPAPVSPDPVASPAPAAAPILAVTGSEAAVPAALGGVALLATGAAVLLARRFRRSAR